VGRQFWTSGVGSAGVCVCVCFLFFGLNFTYFLRKAFGLGEKEDAERVEDAMA
jgi:hypothetical protein